MDGWSKIAAGVVLGVAGTVYATNRKVREKLPDAARDLPDNVRGRFRGAVNAAREASAGRREEILRDLRTHTEAHPPRVKEDAFGATARDTEASKVSSDVSGDTPADETEAPPAS